MAWGVGTRMRFLEGGKRMKCEARGLGEVMTRDAIDELYNRYFFQRTLGFDLRDVDISSGQR